MNTAQYFNGLVGNPIQKSHVQKQDMYRKDLVSQCQTGKCFTGQRNSDCLIRPRNYVQPWTERPGYYLDFTQPCIGGRPVHQAFSVNSIPNTMRYDVSQLGCRDFYCQQPNWSARCL